MDEYAYWFRSLVLFEVLEHELHVFITLHVEHVLLVGVGRLLTIELQKHSFDVLEFSLLEDGLSSGKLVSEVEVVLHVFRDRFRLGLLGCFGDLLMQVGDRTLLLSLFIQLAVGDEGKGIDVVVEEHECLVGHSDVLDGDPLEV